MLVRYTRHTKIKYIYVFTYIMKTFLKMVFIDDVLSLGQRLELVKHRKTWYTHDTIFTVEPLTNL